MGFGIVLFFMKYFYETSYVHLNINIFEVNFSKIKTSHPEAELRMNYAFCPISFMIMVFIGGTINFSFCPFNMR